MTQYIDINKGDFFGEELLDSCHYSEKDLMDRIVIPYKYPDGHYESGLFTFLEVYEVEE